MLNTPGTYIKLVEIFCSFWEYHRNSSIAKRIEYHKPLSQWVLALFLIFLSGKRKEEAGMNKSTDM